MSTIYFDDSFGNRRSTTDNLKKYFELLTKNEFSRLTISDNIVKLDGKTLIYDFKLDLNIEIKLSDGSVRNCLLNNFRISRIRETAVEDIRELVYSKTGIVADLDHFVFENSGTNLTLIQS